MFNYEYWLERVKEKYGKHWEVNDVAHRQDHFDDVYRLGVKLNDAFDFGYLDEDIFAVAYFHDLFSWSRVNHHELSHQFILTTDCEIITRLLGKTGSFGRELVSKACLEHRASFKGEYSSKFSELMASADRGEITSVEDRVRDIVTRAYKFAVSNGSPNPLEVTLEHMTEKFGSNGYQKLPTMYSEFYKELLHEVKLTIDSLTIEDIKSIVK